MKRKNATVNQLIEQGYMITDANTKYAGEPWEMTAELEGMFTPAFLDLRDAQAVVENIRIEKEALAKRNRDERVKMEHSLARLKQFILVVADQETAQAMFHTLGIDDDYPNKDEDFVTKIMSTVLPHLNDWDGTPQEIEGDIKTEVNGGAMEFADAVRDNIEKQAESTTATADRDNKRDAYEDVLTRIRNWLYLRLPEEKYDSRLDEYGFDIWDKPTYGDGEEPEPPEPPENWDDAPTEFTVTKTAVGDSIDIKCGLHPDADGINIYHAEGPYGGGGIIPLRPASPEWVEAPMPLQVDVAYNMRHWLWVCAVKDGVEGAFAGPLWIEFTE